MPDIDRHDIDYNKKREAAERQASALANDKTAKTAHKTLAVLYGERVVDARRAINASSVDKANV